MLMIWFRKFKDLLASYWLPKMLCLNTSLTMKKGYIFDNHKKMQIILSEHQISVLRLNNDIVKSMYEGKNVLNLAYNYWLVVW